MEEPFLRVKTRESGSRGRDLEAAERILSRLPIFGRVEEFSHSTGNGGYRYCISSIHHTQNKIWIEEYQVQRV